MNQQKRSNIDPALFELELSTQGLDLPGVACSFSLPYMFTFKNSQEIWITS